MFSDLSEIEYINNNNMNIFKEDISYQQEDISHQQDQYIFESEFLPSLFKSEFEFKSNNLRFVKCVNKYVGLL
jgi:hypothetical protein